MCVSHAHNMRLESSVINSVSYQAYIYGISATVNIYGVSSWVDIQYTELALKSINMALAPKLMSVSPQANIHGVSSKDDNLNAS